MSAEIIEPELSKKFLEVVKIVFSEARSPASWRGGDNSQVQFNQATYPLTDKKISNGVIRPKFVDQMRISGLYATSAVSRDADNHVMSLGIVFGDGLDRDYLGMHFSVEKIARFDHMVSWESIELPSHITLKGDMQKEKDYDLFVGCFDVDAFLGEASL